MKPLKGGIKYYFISFPVSFRSSGRLTSISGIPLLICNMYLTSLSIKLDIQYKVWLVGNSGVTVKTVPAEKK